MMEIPKEYSIIQELTSSPTAHIFNTFSEVQILEIQSNIPTGNSSRSRILRSSILDFSRFLLYEYPFEKLLLIDDRKRKLFAFAMAQCWIFTRTIKQDPRAFSFHNCFASPLSILLSSDYRLLIDEIEIIESLTQKKVIDLLTPTLSKTPIDYEKRFTHWDFLKDMSDASVNELKTLVLVANAMSTQTHLLEFSRIIGEKGIGSGLESLSKRGLLYLDIQDVNLLTIFPLDKIKSFAVGNGLVNIPSRKDDVINLIKEKCEPKAISDFVKVLVNDPVYGHNIVKEIYLQPSIPNAKIFQEYIRGELNRLSLYLEFIGCIEYDHKTIITPILKHNKPGNRPGDPILKFTSHDNFERAISPNNFNENITQTDLQLIKKYWDKNCDILLSKVKDENNNSFPLGQLVSEIILYWEKIGVFNLYKQETMNPVFETHWYWLLNSYASLSLSADKAYQLKDTKQICNGCGSSFKEWSISLDYALSVGKKIEFCQSCYQYIFNHRFMANNTKSAQMPENEMLDLLFKLSKAIGFIPTRAYMEKTLLPSEPIEKQIEIGKTLLQMPAYDIYVEKFGNWLKCLTLAGVLDDGHRKTSRGIQCLAKDGHLCLSLGEKAIDDWLSNHKIAHEKEAFYPFDEKLNPNRLSRVDWKIGNIFIEYAGLMDVEEYADKMERKRKLAEKSKLQLIVIEPSDLFDLDDKFRILRF